jgi:hypothetical protein
MSSENLSTEQSLTPKPSKPVKRPKSEVPRPSRTPRDYPPPLPMLELNGNMPIPLASEPLQYRAIGLVRGKYSPAPDELTRGSLLADDGTLIDAVLLGRIMSLTKKHLDLEQSHLWVVYPRIRKDDGKLHIQVMGIWDPKLVYGSETAATPVVAEELLTPDNMGIPDNYFSVRGEVIFQARDTKEIFVKVRQASRKKDEEPRHFKLRLIGDFPQKMVGDFWEFDVLRQGDDLVIRTGNQVATLRPKTGKGGGRPGGGGQKPFRKYDGDDHPSRPARDSEGKAERPVIKRAVEGETPIAKPTARPLPKKAENASAD